MKVRKLILIIVIAFVGMIFSFSAVQAYPVNVGDQIRLIDRLGSPGGEFGVAKLPNANDQLFVTFCVQKTEYIDFNAAGFNVIGITDHTVAGNDVLDEETAYLFYMFSTKQLSNYAYTAAKANSLQNAIWYFEDEITSTSDSDALAWIKEAEDAVDAGWLNEGRVKIMNLTWATARGGFAEGANAQDQLILVPEPMTMLLLGFGLLGLGLARRQR